MTIKSKKENFSLYFFSILTVFIAYGFALTNFSLTVDSESPIYPHSSLDLGRWGTNLVRYHLMDGLYPYFTLLFGLIFLALTSVEITKILKIKGLYAYFFCLLFLSFPQHAYQLVFTMQADAIPLGYFLGTLAVHFYIKNKENNIQNIIYNIITILLLVCTIATYQALIFIPFVLYVIYFFTQINNAENDIKTEIKKGLWFALIFGISIILYFFSVKLFCPVINNYLGDYASGNLDNPFTAFYNLLVDNIYGNFYYGEKPFLIASLCVLISFIWFIKEKTNAWLKILLFLTLLICPFAMSFFIRNGYHPPRIYVSSTLVFAYVIVFVFQYIPKKFLKTVSFIAVLLFLWNVFYITNLFYSQNKIFKHDLELAKSVTEKINEIEDFNPETDYVYFYGVLPESHHIKLALPNSEIFGGSIFRWGNGDNWRVINFFRFNDIAYYRFMDDETSYNKVKNNFSTMPVYPKKGSIQKFENVIIVKFSQEKGFARYEWEK